MAILDPEGNPTLRELTGHFTLSLPNASGNLPELAMVKEVTPEEMEVIVSSYNNVTQQMDGLVSVPGVYATPPNGKSFEHDFTDANKLEGLRLTAAKFIYGKGIMDGYSDRTFWKAVEAIFDFTADGYAWYVEMFVGLYLLTPFINLAYNGLESRTNKKWLIAILLILTVLPTVSETFITNMIFSDYWLICYPVTFYLIGAYINEYKLKFNPFLLLFISFVSIAVTVSLQFVLNRDGKYSPFVMHGFNCLTSVIVAVSLFLLLYHADVKNKISHRTDAFRKLKAILLK